ncbi:MAG TPA: hypothetical protein VFQ00_05420 [Terriglobales bacterium]|nr:hypothetical protein [Terriglobales bacterium]
MSRIEASKLRDKAGQMRQAMISLFYDSKPDWRRFSSGIALLAVHSAILLMDAVRAELSSPRKGHWEHHESVDEFHKLCKSKGDSAGIKHIRWLIGYKHKIAYTSDRIDDSHVNAAIDHAEKFFTWANREYLKELQGVEENFD